MLLLKVRLTEARAQERVSERKSATPCYGGVSHSSETFPFIIQIKVILINIILRYKFIIYEIIFFYILFKNNIFKNATYRELKYICVHKVYVKVKN